MSKRSKQEKSEAESQAEGGMRASEPGHVGEERMEDLVREANEEEGHMPQGDEGRRNVNESAGGEEDIGIEGMSPQRLDERRRAAKRSYRPTGTAE
jgi:hypothetical protein